MAGGNKGATMQAKLRGDLLSYPVDANKIIFRGAAVTIIAATGGAAHDITAASRYVGQSEEYVDNSTPGVLGTKKVRVRRKGIVKFQLTRTVTQETFAATALQQGAGSDTGKTIFTMSASSSFLAGDYIKTSNDFVGVLAAYNNKIMFVTLVAAAEVTVQVPYVAGTPAGTETADIDKCVPAATDLHKVAFLATVQAATVEEQAQVLATTDTNKVILGTIVKVELTPEPYVWVEIDAGRPRGANASYSTTVTGITVVEGIVLAVTGS